MKIITTIFLLTVLATLAKSQTNVSGGIYSNTTWTLANSPYIVIDTTVVFPGVTLTIEPGVTVKFDNQMYLEMRQSTLIAIGTITDSITFTSNSISPAPGIYAGLHADQGYGSQITYCNFKYAKSIYGGDTIRNCKATYNENGLSSLDLIDSCIIRYCTVLGASSHDIKNCIFSNNFKGATPGFNIINCIIDSSTTFGIQYNGGGNGFVSNCKIRYDSIGIGYGNYTVNNCIITHHKFGIANTTGFAINNCTIDSNFIGIVNGEYANSSSIGGSLNVSHCEINYNSIGIYNNIQLIPSGNNTISYSQLNYNGIGIQDNNNSNNFVNTITNNDIEYDSIGISLSGFPDAISCNRICNNISYGLKYFGSSNMNAANNYWCTSDSVSTQVLIYDGYDNVSYGLVSYMPLDSTCAPFNAINENQIIETINIYPNPASDFLILDSRFKFIRIFNLLGELNFSLKLSGDQNILDISILSDGLYLIEMSDGKITIKQKFIKESSQR